MTSESRAFVALVSGQLAQQSKTGSISERGEGGQKFTFGKDRRSVSATAPQRTCGVVRDAAGDNYCLRDPDGRDHICLSLYGQLFEGFDHGSASHFNGFVDGPEITLYDFAESDYFSYSLTER
jgi:hypothetical protein